MLQGYFDDDGRPMLEAVVKLHGYGIRAVPFVVDTGADNTVLSFQDAKEIGVDVTQLEDDPIAVKGMGGTAYLYLLQATILFASERTQKGYAIDIGVPAEDYGLFSLLGRDILNDWSIRYDHREDVLAFAIEGVGPRWPRASGRGAHQPGSVATSTWFAAASVSLLDPPLGQRTFRVCPLVPRLRPGGCRR